LGVAWLIGRLRTPAEARRSWMGDAIRAGAGVVATYGTWLATSLVLHLPATAVQTFNPDPGPKTLVAFLRLHTRNAYKPLRDRWIDQFWGDFGGVTLPLPHWVQAIITAAAVLTLAALLASAVAALARLVRRRVRPLDDGELTALVHIGLCALAVVATLGVLHAADFLQFRRNGRLELLQGRYGLMALPSALALPALLARQIAPRLHQSAVPALVAGAVVALNALGLTMIVERYYL
jgi:hypothetical protein